MTEKYDGLEVILMLRTKKISSSYTTTITTKTLKATKNPVNNETSKSFLMDSNKLNSIDYDCAKPIKKS
ncbi:4325_t:CDS:2 [Entrophospora sp. SA101]|nr:4325_t:CDS:2 [Entrophospora sp. SA101]